ncbi:5-oxoprolinase subunit PxpA [Pseudarthrobacter phenanthrenivorans]|uniref:LamB/YcsF family protein n=1 Tax=Pseudarthrobacter phenanthrenivorans TaxID=361575 RepID=A0A0B4DTD9_PSEPS|nr:MULTISPECIES: 5-oxoprolinase subunit PxpA [Micrococcaceae]KIC69966.1 LamB/YcsF family protein [Pseudarthrobacter phenanthrenivorans]MDJ0457680.1 5-oxoprolinase subunit PxpA [Arthrobacter sp. NQ7]
MQKNVTETTPARVLLNSDMGEGFGLHEFGNDVALMEIIDVANVACGYHAGDPDVMNRTVALAAEHGVAVGAHPGLPDPMGFGRRRMVLSPDEVESIILYQTGALTAFLAKNGLSLNHIKPHGALYGMLAGDEELMQAAAGTAKQFGVPFYGLAGTAHETVCRALGVDFVAELYVDLNYGPGGELLIQRRPEPTDPAAAAERVSRAVAGEPVPAVDGTPLNIAFQSICVHSDAPNAVAVASAVRKALDSSTSTHS